MHTYRIEKVIPKTGKVELDALPFAAGATVEIIVIGPDEARNSLRPSLKGSVVKYDNPFEPIAENDWEAMK